MMRAGEGSAVKEMGSRGVSGGSNQSRPCHSMLCFRDATATSSMISQSTGSSGLSRLAFPYQRCFESSCTTVGSSKSGSKRSFPFRHALAKYDGQTTMTTAGSSESATAKASLPVKPADQQIAISGVQVPAGRIAAQRPPRAAGLLPGGQGEGVFEQPREGADRDRRARHSPRTVQALIRRRERLLVQAEDRQVHQRRPFVPAERVRLVRPVQVAKRAGVAVEVMLGLLVVPHHDFKLLYVVHVGGGAYHESGFA